MGESEEKKKTKTSMAKLGLVWHTSKVWEGARTSEEADKANHFDEEQK